tara:strand:+ start:131 stop:730 length:600 start_codon:yes stop_codon:yes gene_type:complete
MENKILVFDDVIDLEYQNIIKEILLGDRQYKGYDFPWYLTHDVTKPAKADSQLRPAFFHGYVDYPSELSSSFHDLFTKLIQNSCGKLRLENVRVIQGRSFCQLPISSEVVSVDTPHIDTKDDHFVMLYYVCDSDGDTIIYNETVESENYTIQQRITPKQGRVVLFDGAYYHTAEQPLNNIRCVVNYNLENYGISHKKTE